MRFKLKICNITDSVFVMVPVFMLFHTQFPDFKLKNNKSAYHIRSVSYIILAERFDNQQKKGMQQ